MVCRVFKKKNYQRAGLNITDIAALDDDELHPFPVPVPAAMGPTDHKHNPHLMQYEFSSFDPTMQLPQLMNADQPVPTLLPSQQPGVPIAMSSLDVECSQNLMKLTSNGSDGMLHGDAGSSVDRFAGTTDWSILDKLLASHQNLDQLFQGKVSTASASSLAPFHQHQLMELGGSSSSSLQRLPLQYLGGEAADLHRFPKQ